MRDYYSRTIAARAGARLAAPSVRPCYMDVWVISIPNVDSARNIQTLEVVGRTRWSLRNVTLEPRVRPLRCLVSLAVLLPAPWNFPPTNSEAAPPSRVGPDALAVGVSILDVLGRGPVFLPHVGILPSTPNLAIVSDQRNSLFRRNGAGFFGTAPSVKVARRLEP